MKETRILNILICGIGGQGIISFGDFLKRYFFNNFNLINIVGTETRGVSQREGSVISTIRIVYEHPIKRKTESNKFIINSKKELIYLSPEIPLFNANIIIAFEPIEFIRNLKFANKNTILIVNNIPILPKNAIVNLISKNNNPIKEQPPENLNNNTKISNYENLRISNWDLTHINSLKEKIKQYLFYAFFKDSNQSDKFEEYLSEKFFYLNFSEEIFGNVANVTSVRDSSFKLLEFIIKIIESNKSNLNYQDLFNKEIFNQK